MKGLTLFDVYMAIMIAVTLRFLIHDSLVYMLTCMVTGFVYKVVQMNLERRDK